MPVRRSDRAKRHRLEVHPVKRALVLTLAAAACSCRSSSGAVGAVGADASPAPSARVHATAASNALLAEQIDAFVSGFGVAWGDAHAAHGFVAVTRDGAIVFAKAYGTRAGLDTRFAIGSVTKTLTAACILRLVDKGKLSLSEPVTKFLPAYRVSGADKLTLRHLATHTSGIPSYTDEPDLMSARSERRESASILARISARPLAFPPGSHFAYSNSNYYLLGLVIERIAGEPYEAALRHLVLEPARMTRTTLTAPRDDDEAPGRTVDDDDRLVPARSVEPAFTFAASGARSTARDLFAFDRALLGPLLSEASRIEMATPHKGEYGCGWDAWREAGYEIVSHEGGIDGYSSFFGRAPGAGVAVAVLLATDAFSGDRLEAGAIGEPILAMTLTRRAVAPPKETAVSDQNPTGTAAFAGDYLLQRSTPGKVEPKRAREVPSPPRLSVASASGRLFMSPEKEPRVRLYPASDGSFFPKQIGVKVSFSGSELALTRFGREMVYRRIAR